MWDARKRCSAYAMPGRSFKAFFCVYGTSSGGGSVSQAGTEYFAAMAVLEELLASQMRGTVDPGIREAVLGANRGVGSVLLGDAQDIWVGT